jgi:hypothetical protein
LHRNREGEGRQPLGYPRPSREGDEAWAFLARSDH